MRRPPDPGNSLGGCLPRGVIAFSSGEGSMNQVVREGMAVDVEAAARGETRGDRESDLSVDMALSK